jgi:protein-arginine kinase activator protein McsA
MAVRVVSDANGVRRVEIECDGCGYTWQSASRSGRTTCPECGERPYIPAALRREAYEPTPVIVDDSDAPPPPRGFFGGGKSSRSAPQVTAHRPRLGHTRVVTDAHGTRRTEVECHSCGYTWAASSRSDRTICPDCRAAVYISVEPEPPAPAQSQAPKAPRARKQSQVTSEGGWLTGLAAAAVVATEVASALRAARTPLAPTGARATAGSPPSRSPLAPAAADRPGQYGPRRQPARRAPSRTASSIAKLSCQHSVRLRGRPSELLGGFVECPQCEVKVTVVEAEPTRDAR